MTTDSEAVRPDWMGANDYFEMLEDRSAGTFYWDCDKDTVQCSPKLAGLLGHKDQPSGSLLNFKHVIHPDDANSYSKTLQKAIATKTNYKASIRLRNEEGVFSSFRIKGYWLKRSQSSAGFLAGFLVETSEEDLLRAQMSGIERLYQAFFDHAPAAVYMKDKNRIHLYGNPVAARIAGCSVDAFVGATTAELFDEETDAALVDVDRRILEEGEVVVRHGEFQTPDGETHYVYDTSFPLEDPLTGDKLIGGFGLDTTKQHEAETALAQTQKMDALGQLVGGIAHDFNNTLAVLRGSLDLIAISDTEAEVEECLSEIASGVDRGAKLTEQLLAYARKAVLQTEVLNLNSVINDIDRMLRRTLPETIEIETVSGGGLWNTRMDRHQVENAVLNIALNARDAMPQGGKITIETSNVRIDEQYVWDRSEDLKPGRFVLLAITDTGVGMRDDVLNRAFDPFFTTKAIGEGTGMGLSMVEGLMRQIDGVARIYSEEGVGTTLKLYFPAFGEDLSATQRQPEIHHNSNEHILLVEDDADVRRVLRRQLRKLNFRVTEVDGGQKGLDALLSDPTIQLLLTDIVMPGQLQGPELAKRARDLRPDLPVVFMSGYPQEAAIHGNGVNPSDISLMKPLKSDDLVRALRKLLDAAP